MLDIDQIISHATAGLALDCKPGCDYCCRQLIVLTSIGDAREILRTARRRMSVIEFSRFRREIKQQALAIEAMSYEEAEVKAWPCPLLIDHRCSVYDVRPVACRSVVSEDVNCCKAMLEAQDFAQLSPEHQIIATTISERAMRLQFKINDRRPIDGAFELRSLLATLINTPPTPQN